MSLASQARREAGEIILAKANQIAESWRDAVRGDQSIHGDDRLPDLLLVNQVPALLSDIARALIDPEEAVETDVSIARRRRGLKIGKLRGLAHYDASDIYREFQHLRHAIWRFLRSKLDWQRGDAFEVMLAVDQFLDEVIGATLRGYFETAERVAVRRDSPSGTSMPRASGEGV
jgi:hypothetical protein